MRFKPFFIFFFIIAGGVSVAQTGYPEGGYKTLLALQTRTPNVEGELAAHPLIEQKEDSLLCTRYAVLSNDNRLNNGDIRHDFICFSDGQYLYINCQYFNLGKGFERVLDEGRLLVFANNDVNSTVRLGAGAMGVLLRVGEIHIQHKQ